MGRRLSVKLGERYGRLLVVTREENSKRGQARWTCQCDCGNSCVSVSAYLAGGLKKSCGCMTKELRSKIRRTHGATGTPTHKSWTCMMHRCFRLGDKSYWNYGAIGITVCERWRKFENFLADMGPRPAGKSIDRFPNKEGNYEPSNCRWATSTEQNNNRKDNRFIEANGKRQTIGQWATETGVSKLTIVARLNRGWPQERCIDPPGQRL